MRQKETRETGGKKSESVSGAECITAADGVKCVNERSLSSVTKLRSQWTFPSFQRLIALSENAQVIIKPESLRAESVPETQARAVLLWRGVLFKKH